MAGLQLFPSCQIVLFIAIHVILVVVAAGDKTSQPEETKPSLKIFEDAKPLNVTKKAKQDEGDDGEGEDGGDEAVGGAAAGGGLGNAAALFNMGGAQVFSALFGVFPPLVSTFAHTTRGVNQVLNGTDTPDITSFLAKQTAAAVKLVQSFSGQQNNPHDLLQQIPKGRPTRPTEPPIYIDDDVTMNPVDFNQEEFFNQLFQSTENIRNSQNGVIVGVGGKEGDPTKNLFWSSQNNSNFDIGNAPQPDESLNNELAQSISQYLHNIRTQTLSTGMAHSEILKMVFQTTMRPTIIVYQPSTTTLVPITTEKITEAAQFGQKIEPLSSVLSRLQITPSQPIIKQVVEQQSEMKVPFKETTIASLLQQELEEGRPSSLLQPQLSSFLGKQQIIPLESIKFQSQMRQSPLTTSAPLILFKAKDISPLRTYAQKQTTPSVLRGQSQSDIMKQVTEKEWEVETTFRGAERTSTSKPTFSFSKGRPGYWMNMFYPDGVPIFVKDTDNATVLTTVKARRRRRRSTTTARPTDADYYEDDDGKTRKAKNNDFQN